MAKVLTLESYLKQVKARYSGYQSAQLQIDSAKIRYSLRPLQYSPLLNTDILSSRDPRPDVTDASLQADRVDSNTFKIGVSYQSPYGVFSEGSVNLERNKVTGLKNPLLNPEEREYAASLSAKVSVQLWKNAFGAMDQSYEKQRQHANLAEVKAQEFKQLMIVERAKIAYWRLALVQRKLAVRQSIVKSSRELIAFVKKREAKRLVDKIDLYQAESNYALRKLELQQLRGSIDQYSLEFNFLRQMEGAEFSETLESPEAKSLLNMAVTTTRESREDLEGKFEAAQAAREKVLAEREQIKPDLRFFLQLDRKRYDSGLGSASSELKNMDNPRVAYGLKFSYLLDQDLVARSERAYTSEEMAEKISYEDAVIENRMKLASLKKRIGFAQEYLKNTLNLVKAEKKKYSTQSERFRDGIASTDEFLRFEDMYHDAQIINLDAQIELLKLLAEHQSF